MPTRQINARDLIFQVQDISAVWRTVAGINSASVNYAESEETTETTTYDSQGDAESEIMQRGASLKLEGRKKSDPATGVYDVGQATLDYYAVQFATASQCPVRFRYPGETQYRNWTATVSRGEEGGGNNDKVGFSYTITRSGHTTLTAAP